MRGEEAGGRFRLAAVCETVVSVISLRSVAAWAALVGGALWLAQGVVLIARGGAEPDPRIEAVTFSCGFMALVAAAGIASWVSSAAKSRAARAALAVLAALSVPMVVILGQAAAFALPGSHWLESDAIVLVIALAAISCGISWLRRPAHSG
jgi:cellobiose-specific phosphotransferase system component IIC